MTAAELFEEIRALLREPQLSTPGDPWEYQDDDLVVQVRSALRHIIAKGVLTDVAMSKDGVLDPAPDEKVGMLLAYQVASALLSGDLTQMLLDGELGISFRSGPDQFDSKRAAITFKEIAGAYTDEADRLLTIVLSDQSGSGALVYGESTTSAG